MQMENEINDPISEKIARAVTEAKLDVTEKRLHFVLWFGGVFITLVAMIISIVVALKFSEVNNTLDKFRQEASQTRLNIQDNIQSSDEKLDRNLLAMRSDVRAQVENQEHQLGYSVARVDKTIQEVKDLAGSQFNKPLLECFLKGSSLEGSSIQLTQNRKHASIQIKNTGKASARNIKVRLYSYFSTDCIIRGGNTHWIPISESDEPNYKCYSEATLPTIYENGDSSPIDIVLSDDSINNGKYPSIMKLFYEQQSEPRKYSFSIILATQ